uniref:Uncharacterized protein n=1 Tax=Setaria italica TaxID=4555 RepID=K3YMX8_SETIT
MSASEGETSAHADSLTAKLAEHCQHLVSIQGLINQLKEAILAMQQSIEELSEEVNCVTFRLQTFKHESSSEISEMTSKLSSAYRDKPGCSPALNPWYFLLFACPFLSLGCTSSFLLIEKNDDYFAHDIRWSVREAALSKPLRNTERPQDKNSDNGSEHFFILLLGLSSPQMKFPKSTSDIYYNADSPINTCPVLLSELNGHDPISAMNFLDPVSVFSPPLWMESSQFHDADEDLLGMSSQTQRISFWKRLMQH